MMARKRTWLILLPPSLNEGGQVASSQQECRKQAIRRIRSCDPSKTIVYSRPASNLETETVRCPPGYITWCIPFVPLSADSKFGWSGPVIKVSLPQRESNSQPHPRWYPLHLSTDHGILAGTNQNFFVIQLIWYISLLD